MKVDLGNANAVDVVISPNGETAFVNLEGERVTTFFIPDERTVVEAFQIVLAGLPRLINPTARPWWVDSDNEMVQSMLLDHFGLARSTTRPPNWGDGTTINPPETKKAKADKAKSEEGSA